MNPPTTTTTPTTSAAEEKDCDNSTTTTNECKKRSIDDVQGGKEKDQDQDQVGDEGASNKKPKTDNDDDDDKGKGKEPKEQLVVENNSSSNNNNNNKPNLADIMEGMKQKLERLIGIECTTSVIELLEQWETKKEEAATNNNTNTNNTNSSSTRGPRLLLPKKGVEDETKYVTLPLIEDKQVRKEIHMFIKSDPVKNVAMADTVDKKIRIWHKLFEKQMPNYKKFGTNNEQNHQQNQNQHQRAKREPWPNDRPNFLRFVMYKENIDTVTAVKDVARIARIHPKRPRNMKGVSGGITYAGMKDKRGITTQYCTAFRKTPQDLLVLNEHQKSAKGGGNTKNNGSGIIRVGSFSYVNRELRLGMLSGNRFDIVLRNVCIEQRDDVKLSRQEMVEFTTTKLRDAAKAMKEIGFINFFGMQRFGKYHDTHLVGIAVLKGDFKEACDLIMRVKAGEQERYKKLRELWEKRFSDIDQNDEESANEAEMKCAKEVLKGLGRFMNCETSIVHSLFRRPRDYKKAFGSIAKHMRSMFLHAYQSYLWNKAASHRIEKGGATEVMEGDLVLIGNSQLEESGSGLKGKKVVIVTQDDVETGKYKITDVVIPLVGSRVTLPTNCTGNHLETMLKEDGLSLESFQKIRDRELALGGDYRKMICKPSDVDFGIKLYKDPLQPLIQTDLMTIHDEKLECVDVTSELGDTDEGIGDKVLVAMVIGFTLPPSAYATIALRELMKRPTSTEYQTSLNLEGNCEDKSESG